MNEVRVSRRSDLDEGEAGTGWSDATVHVAMEMATVATSTATETTGATVSEPIARNHHGKRRWRSEAPAADITWRSRMDRTIQQQAQELRQLHQTVVHLAKLVEA
jgi:hypothetical protein